MQQLVDQRMRLQQGFATGGTGLQVPNWTAAVLRPTRLLWVHLHAADRQWVTRADPAVQFWAGDTKPIGSGLTLVRLGGHFDSGTVLHWAHWSEGRGVLLSGDILQVVPSGHVSFMWSYPNLIPLSAAKVQRMAEILERVFRPGADRRKRQASGRGVDRALHRADQRDKRSQR